RLLGRLVEGWAYQRPEPDDIREVDAGVYVVTGALHSKHMDADSEIVSPYRQRLEFRDGLLVKSRLTTGEEPENIAMVRRFTEAFNRLDLDSVTADLHPEVQLDEWPAAPGARSYRGVDGIRQALDSWLESWEWMRVEV